MIGSALSVGLIGCGYAAEVHAVALRSVRRARITAIADIDDAARESWAARVGPVQAFADYRQLLDQRAIDVVAILTPPALHLPMTAAALDAGKHVLLEKPITRDLEEADRLLAHASRTRSRVIVGYNLRFHRQLQEARRRVQEGELGTVEFVRGVASSTYQFGRRFPAYRRRRDLGGGVLIELAVHHFDLWPYLLGEEVAEVIAVSRSSEGDDSTATVAARMTSGIVVTSAFSEAAGEQHEIEVYGERGRIRASLYRFDGFDLIPSGVYEGHPVRRAGRLVAALARLPGAVHASRRGGVFLDSYRSLWQQFVDGLLTSGPIEPLLEDGRQSLRVALAAVQAADTGRAVRVLDAPRSISPGRPPA
jgi:myo-inositol 2-dehydrogenase / D-chiro-inositol 1-dehydrogenase